MKPQQPVRVQDSAQVDPFDDGVRPLDRRELKEMGVGVLPQRLRDVTQIEGIRLEVLLARNRQPADEKSPD